MISRVLLELLVLVLVLLLVARPKQIPGKRRKARNIPHSIEQRELNGILEIIIDKCRSVLLFLCRCRQVLSLVLLRVCTLYSSTLLLVRQ